MRSEKRTGIIIINFLTILIITTMEGRSKGRQDGMDSTFQG